MLRWNYWVLTHQFRCLISYTNASTSVAETNATSYVVCFSRKMQLFNVTLHQNSKVDTSSLGLTFQIENLLTWIDFPRLRLTFPIENPLLHWANATQFGVVHKWRHIITGRMGSPDLWQFVTRGRGESVALWCHMSRFDMHATRSYTRKERCGGQNAFIPFTMLQPMR